VSSWKNDSISNDIEISSDSDLTDSLQNRVEIYSKEICPSFHSRENDDKKSVSNDVNIPTRERCITQNTSRDLLSPLRFRALSPKLRDHKSPNELSAVRVK
jgi:hypothetical protein